MYALVSLKTSNLGGSGKRKVKDHAWLAILGTSCWRSSISNASLVGVLRRDDCLLIVASVMCVLLAFACGPYRQCSFGRMPRTDTASCLTAHAVKLGLLLISAYVCHGSVAAPSTGAGGRIVRFTCVKDDASALPADDRFCSVGQRQLGMALVDSGLGRLSLELSNRGAARSVVTEVRVVDEAATLSDSPLAEMTSSPEGQVHFKRANKEVPFFGSSGQSDLVLVRRPEFSRTGRMMKLNGINNSLDGGEALTLTLNTANEAFDAEIVGEAVRDCLLRVGVLVTGFEGDPSATRRGEWLKKRAANKHTRGIVGESPYWVADVEWISRFQKTSIMPCAKEADTCRRCPSSEPPTRVKGCAPSTDCVTVLKLMSCTIGPDII